MEREIRKRFASIPQQKVMLTKAHTTYVIAGRGSGKTTELLAGRSYQLIHSLPGCTILIYGQSYQQLLLITLKELFLGWDRLGFKEGVHYVVRKMPPKHWPKPHRMPLRPDFSIFTYNGVCLQMMSEDVFNNGGSAQALIVDEFRKLKKEKLHQLSLTLRDDTFCKGNPDFMASIMVSDQPDRPSEQWIFDYEKDMDKEQIELIQQAQFQMDRLLVRYYTPGTADTTKQELMGQINKLQKILVTLRRDSVLFLEYSTIDNLNAVGVDFINRMKRELDDQTFRVSILNKRKKKSSSNFYHNFDEDRHTYIQFNNEYLQGLSLDYNKPIRMTCLQDSDLLVTKGLDLTIDSGGSINVCLTGQDQGNIYRVLKGMFAKPEDNKKLTDLIEEWCNYYADHPTKRVRFIYDQTDVGTHSVSVLTPADEVKNILKKRGWILDGDHYMPVVPSPQSRYIFCEKLFAEATEHLPKVRINKQHCDNLISGLLTTETREGRTGFEKDKHLERRKDLPQEKLTHFPDAFDKLLYYCLANRLQSDSGFTYTMTA
jgi:hypothetical protein